jgi:hypothetical protein
MKRRDFLTYAGLFLLTGCAPKVVDLRHKAPVPTESIKAGEKQKFYDKDHFYVLYATDEKVEAEAKILRDERGVLMARGGMAPPTLMPDGKEIKAQMIVFVKPVPVDRLVDGVPVKDSYGNLFKTDDPEKAQKYGRIIAAAHRRMMEKASKELANVKNPEVEMAIDVKDIQKALVDDLSAAARDFRLFNRPLRLPTRKR